LFKPLDLDQLEVTIERALKNFELRKRVDLLSEQIQREQPSSIIGESQGLKQALSLAKLVGATDDTTVLISGETGTGKELIAKYIHDNSPRSNGPLYLSIAGLYRKILQKMNFLDTSAVLLQVQLKKCVPANSSKPITGLYCLTKSANSAWICR